MRIKAEPVAYLRSTALSDHQVRRPRPNRSSSLTMAISLVNASKCDSPSPMACDCAACACSGELRHVRFFKEIIEPTIAVEAAVVVSVPAQQVIELVSGESTSTPPLEVAGLNGR